MSCVVCRALLLLRTTCVVCRVAAAAPQVRLCLAKKDYIRAQILARKISPRAFQKQQGDSKGEIGIEGTAIEEADKVGVCLTCLGWGGQGVDKVDLCLGFGSEG